MLSPLPRFRSPRAARAMALLLSTGVLTMPAPANAHSMTTLENDLGATERYAQFVDQPAAPFALVDADGQPAALVDFRGKTIVLNFLYLRCRDSCPLHSALIARVQSMIDEVPGLSEQVQFVTIATDAENAKATATLMRNHGITHGLQPDNWLPLFGGVGRERAGIELARAYGLEFVPTDDGVQMHGTVTHVIDPEGRLRARFHGLKFDPLNLMLYVAALAHGEHPAEQTSSVMSLQPVTAFVGAAIGVCLLVFGGWLVLTRRRRIVATRMQVSEE